MITTETENFGGAEKDDNGFIVGVTFPKKKVLITGISGFAGSHVLRHILINTNWNIVGIASWKHKGLPERVEDVWRDHPEWRDRVTIITHDLISPIPEMTMKRIGVCDYVLNLAADSHVERSIVDPVPFVQNNVNVALHMLEYARQYQPKIFVQFSTDEVYGAAPHGVNHKEWSPIIPSNPYSASKACQEAIAISYWRTYGVPVVITNTMNLFGETQDAEKYIAKLVKNIHNGENTTVHGSPDNIGSRFYLHARNMADALLFILKIPPKSYGESDLPDRYNIVGDDELNNLEIAHSVAEVMGKELKYTFEDFHLTRPGHDRRYALDGSKLKDLGWVAPFPFKDSLLKFIKWTLNNKSWL